MLKDLIKIANALDEKGEYDLANEIDKAAEGDLPENIQKLHQLEDDLRRIQDAITRVYRDGHMKSAVYHYLMKEMMKNDQYEYSPGPGEEEEYYTGMV